MNRIFSFFFCTILFSSAFADHPNEGALTLEEITTRALANNRDVKISEQALSAAAAEKSRARGTYLPEVSLEGGPLTAKFDDERNSGTAVYGKAEWNLYRGGRDSAEIEKAQIEEDLQKKKLELAKNRIKREAARLYYEMLHVLESIALKEQALTMNREQMKLAQVKRSSGFTSEADVLEFELRESTISSDLKLLTQERESLSREISLLLGMNEASEKFTVKGHLETEPLKIDKAKFLSEFKKNNEELLESEAEYQLSLKDKTIARSYFLPSVNFEGSYGKLADDERVFEAANNYSVFLRINIPLFSGFQNYNGYKSSQMRATQKEIEFQGAQAKVSAELDILFSELNSISERIALEEKNIARAQKYYNITISEYKRGVKNSPDVVGATEGLFEARIRNLEFRKDFQVTKLKILAINGSGAL